MSKAYRVQHFGGELVLKDASLLGTVKSEIGGKQAGVRVFWDRAEEQVVLEISMKDWAQVVFLGDLQELEQWALDRVKASYKGRKNLEALVAAGSKQFRIVEGGDLALLFLKLMESAQGLQPVEPPKRKGRPPSKARQKAV